MALEEKIENEERSGILGRLRTSKAFKHASRFMLPILVAGSISFWNTGIAKAKNQTQKGIHCESHQYCENNRIRVECIDTRCNDEVMFKHVEIQDQVHGCLSAYFGFHPNEKVVYSLGKLEKLYSTFTVIWGGEVYGKRVEGFMAGRVEAGHDRVNNPDNVMAEVHETTHVFMDDLQLPLWFNEGIATYTTGKINCHPTTWAYGSVPHTDDYYNLKAGRIYLNEDLRRVHSRGFMFMVGLTEDYGCDSKCVSKFIYSLYVHAVKKHFKIDNSVIKQKAEKATRKDLTPLFNLLDITY